MRGKLMGQVGAQIELPTTICTPTSLQLRFSTCFKLGLKSEAKLGESWATMKRLNNYISFSRRYQLNIGSMVLFWKRFARIII